MREVWERKTAQGYNHEEGQVMERRRERWVNRVRADDRSIEWGSDSYDYGWILVTSRESQ